MKINTLVKSIEFKKALFFLIVGFFVFTKIVFAATAEVVVFTAPHRCPPCQQYEPTIAQLIREGYPITVVNVDAPRNQHERDLLNAMKATAIFNSIPTTAVFNIGDNGKPAGLVDSMEGKITKDGLVGAAGFLTQNNIGKQPPVSQSPKPKPANVPPPIPVPKDEVPDKAFVNPLTCIKKSANSYQCTYTDSTGKKHSFEVVDAPGKNDFFDAIADALKKGIPLMTTDTGLTRPFPVPPPKPSELSSTLPPVPGDDGWEPIPKPPSGAPTAVPSGRGCIVTFPGMVPIEITGKEIDDFYSRSNAVQGDRGRCEVAMMLAAQKKMVPAGDAPTVPKPPMPKPPKYTLEEPEAHKTLKNFWVIKGQVCDGNKCTPFTLTIFAESAEKAKELAEAQLKAASAQPPAAKANEKPPALAPYRRPTVTPNAPLRAAR